MFSYSFLLCSAIVSTFLNCSDRVFESGVNCHMDFAFPQIVRADSLIYSALSLNFQRGTAQSSLI
jgi:hypothetical protein